MIGPSLHERHRSKTPIRKLSLHNKTHNLIIVILSLEIQVKTSPSQHQKHNMPKAKEKSIVMDEEEEVTFHGTINPEEAKNHTIELEKAMDIIEEGVKTGNTTGLLEAAINKIRTTLVKITPHMETANVEAVLRAIKDTACTALMPSDSDHEEMLEAMMPETEMATLEDFLSGTDELGNITEDQKELMGELFEELETAHESMARACSTLGRLARGLKRQTTPTDITGQHAATSSGEHS